MSTVSTALQRVLDALTAARAELAASTDGLSERILAGDPERARRELRVHVSATADLMVGTGYLPSKRQ
jgi:hypothetical protein